MEAFLSLSIFLQTKKILICSNANENLTIGKLLNINKG